ncbi:response regulator transcription factor [Burkholderia sp. Tr-862]|uniref:LuxR C-terminal-related transcriptional regulator n=1 Tax=Burkholderia sp. Tr-862 TaxID=2608331 RepID=UPI0014198BFC|nr:response regulator transcription factor [Burkholderia sp. Tr-862]NIF40136.1 response regulator transcription factor [Burkholderia sp. Tr-862]
MSRALSVLVAVSDPLRCLGIEALVLGAGIADACDFASSTRDLAEKMRRLESYAAAVIDLDLNDAPAFDLIGRIRSLSPAMGVLALDLAAGADRTVRALRSGATGVVGAQATRAEILDALRAVAAGVRFVQASSLTTLINQISGQASEPSHEDLSNREYQTLCMLARGLRLVDVAGELSISVKTASTYRSRLLEKLQLRTNADLIHYALTNGLGVTGPVAGRVRAGTLAERR